MQKICGHLWDHLQLEYRGERRRNNSGWGNVCLYGDGKNKDPSRGIMRSEKDIRTFRVRNTKRNNMLMKEPVVTRIIEIKCEKQE